MALDWDVLNDDCSNISGWTDADTGAGVSSQETFDYRSTFKFSVPTVGAGQLAARFKAVTVPDTFSAEIVIRHETTNGYGPFIDIFTTSGHRYPIVLYYASVGLLSTSPNNYTDAFIVDPTPIATNTYALGEWLTIRLVIKASRKADLWVNNRCYLTGVTCDLSGGATTNRVQVYHLGGASAVGAGLSYFDSIKIDTTPEGQATTGTLNVNDIVLNTRVAHEASQEYNTSTHSFLKYKFRFYHTGCTGEKANCEIPLVATGDTNASSVYIYDGSDVKSLQKIPS